MRRALALSALAPVLVLAAACGGGGGGGTRLAIIGCDGTPLTSAPSLPAGFPKPDGVTYVETELRGPTTVVKGYVEAGLEDAFDAYREAFDAAGYAILADERETFDAEVAYEDPRGEVSGQVALRDRCRESGRIALTITARPA
ncbi:MAG: hypothetical protein ABR521_00600 [Gaiellaceae bacterium]